MAVEIHDEPDKNVVVAHFAAHLDQPLSCLQLSSSGSLLATADALGHFFNVFSIFADPASSAQTAVHHLYTLWRGKTPAMVGLRDVFAYGFHKIDDAESCYL